MKNVSLFLLLIWVFYADRAVSQQPGERLTSVSFPEGYSPCSTSFAYDETLGRYYFLKREEISITDRLGAVIRTINLSNADNELEFFRAWSVTCAGGTFIDHEETWYLLNHDEVMTVWQMQPDGQGDMQVTQTASYDFNSLLGENVVRGIDRAPDGSWWVGTPGSFRNVNPDITGVRETLPFSELSQSITQSDDLEIDPHYIGVDPVSGDIYLYAFLNSQSDGWRSHFYRVDPQGKNQRGRFAYEIPNNTGLRNASRLFGTPDGFVFFDEQNNSLGEYALAAQDLPEVLSVSFAQEGVLWLFCRTLESGTVDYTMEVDWAGEPDDVIDQFPYLITGDPVGNDTIEGSFARVRLKNYPPYPTDDILLRNAADQLSRPVPIQVPLAYWDQGIPFANECIGFYPSESQEGTDVFWTFHGVAPMEPFNAYVEFVDGVPWLGGKRYGIQDVQARGTAEIHSKQEGTVSVGGGGAFLAGSGQIRTDLGGGVFQQLTPEGPEVTGGLVNVKIEGSVSEEAGLVQAFPQLYALRSAPLLGSAIRWLDERATLTATIGAGMDTKTKITTDDHNDLLFAGELTGFLKLGIAAAVRLIGGYAEATAFGEGTGSATFISDASGLTFKEFKLSALIGAKIRAYIVEREVKRVFSVTSTGTKAYEQALPNGGVISDTGWQYAYGVDLQNKVKALAEKPHVITPNPFAEFQKGREKLSRQKVTGAASFDQEVPVLGGIHAGATPFSAWDQDREKQMIVWTQPIEGNPATQATDVYYSYFDGSSFSAPAPINIDTHMDFNPEVAWYEYGLWVAFWEHVALDDFQPSGDPLADNETTIRNLRPCWAYFDPETREWSDVQEIPITGSNAFNTQLMRGTFGQVTACWLESSTGDVMPWDLNAAPPQRLADITLHYSDFSWWPGGSNPPLFATSKILGQEDPDYDPPKDIVDYSAARSLSFLNILVNRMRTVEGVEPLAGNIGIEQWRQQRFISNSAMKLYALQVVDTIGSNPEALISEEANQFLFGYVAIDNNRYGTRPDSPAIFLGSSLNSRGQIFPNFEPAFREHGGEDYYKGSGFQNYQIGALAPRDSQFPTYYAVFSQPDEGGALNLHYGLVNERNPGPIVRDRSSERNLNVSTTADGSVLATYFKASLDQETAPPEKTGLEEELVGYSEQDIGTFSMTRHLVATELMPGGISMRSGLARGGQEVTIRFEVKNPGDRLVSNPHISLYAIREDGSMRQSDPIPILVDYEIDEYCYGNSSVFDEVDWVLPDDGVYSLQLVVDPSNEVEEFDETNNTGITRGAFSQPSSLIDWLLGRLGSAGGLDQNSDGIVDAADVESE